MNKWVPLKSQAYYPTAARRSVTMVSSELSNYQSLNPLEMMSCAHMYFPLSYSDLNGRSGLLLRFLGDYSRSRVSEIDNSSSSKNPNHFGF